MDWRGRGERERVIVVKKKDKNLPPYLAWWTGQTWWTA